MDLSPLKNHKSHASSNQDRFILVNEGWTALVIQGRVQFGNRAERKGLQAVDWQEAAQLLINGETPDQVALAIDTIDLTAK